MFFIAPSASTQVKAMTEKHRKWLHRAKFQAFYPLGKDALSCRVTPGFAGKVVVFVAFSTTFGEGKGFSGEDKDKEKEKSTSLSTDALWWR